MNEWPGVDGGGVAAPSMSGTGQQGGGGVVPRWWNPLDSVAIDAANVWAYRAQASPGSPWGLAPAVYAESLQNWVNPGINNLVEGNGPVPWAALTGWGFVLAAAQWFDTTVTSPDNDWVMFVQYANINTTNNMLCGCRPPAFDLQIFTPNNWTIYNHNAANIVVPALLGGNIGMVGQVSYRNAVNDGALAVIAAPGALSIFIGATNSAGVPVTHATADIHALLICDDATAFTAPDITALAALPAGSMHNL